MCQKLIKVLSKISLHLLCNTEYDSKGQFHLESIELCCFYVFHTQKYLQYQTIF